ncbi:MAG: pyridoxal-phosphate dependent enzyme [Sphaerochaetaceae bacterium]|nr:pyridoxal-phosphate dependent enzyme [Sphaerochaetaceae bacterium]
MDYERRNYRKRITEVKKLFIMTKARLVCVECGSEYEATKLFRCPKDNGELALHYDYDSLKRNKRLKDLWFSPKTLWEKYFDVLPIEDSSKIVTLGEGNTPLLASERLAKAIGVKRLYFKLECCNPTGSFKDRQMTVAVSKGNEWGDRDYATVSSGNVGNALSAYCAKKGFNANIWVSDGTAKTKYQQIQIYGSQLFLFPDPEKSGVAAYNLFFGSLQDYCLKRNIIPMISARPVNPYMIEGSKTISFEIHSQLGHVPPCVFSPIGGGGLYGGLWKGFKEMMYLGFTDTLPAQFGVQKPGYMASILTLDDPAFDSNKYATPLDGRWALQSLKEGSGSYVSVTSEEIFEAQKLLAVYEGIFAEPQGATSVAGLIQMAKAGKLDSYEEIVCIITGAGLKDMKTGESMIQDIRFYRPVEHVSTFAECDDKLKRSIK